MEKHIGKRAVESLGIFWLGFHLIGFVVWQNGGTSYGNIVWRWFQAVLGLELIVLKISIIFLLLAFFTFAVLAIYSSMPNKMSRNENQITPKNPAQNTLDDDQSIPKILFQPTLQKSEPAKPTSNHTQDSPPTATELKLRALKQITGKEYLKK